jgi:hypothetical protein
VSGNVIAWRRVERTWLVAVAVLVLGSCWSGLNHDVRYVLGGLRAAGRGGFTQAETFVHRPLAYRWLLGGLDSLTAGPLVVREALTRLLVMVVVAATTVWLRAALRRHLPREEATAVAAAVGLSLALAPAWDFLQPEWVAVALATAAVAATLGFRRSVVATLTGGVLLSLVVLVKYTTAPTAVIALGVVAVIHRRRAVWTAVAAVVSTAGLFGASVMVEPHEWRWLGELPNLNSGTPLRTGFGQAAAEGLAGSLANEVLLVPAFALLPVSVLLLARTGHRYAWPVLSAGAVLCFVAALIIQGQWFQYHLAVLPVFAAGVWGLAIARWRRFHDRPPSVPVAAAALLGVTVPLVSAASPAWRLAHVRPVYAVLLALILLTLAIAARTHQLPAVHADGAVSPALDGDRSPASHGDRVHGDRAVSPAVRDGRTRRAASPARRVGRSVPVAAALFAGLLMIAVPAWPSSPYSYDRTHADHTPWERAQHWQRVGRQLDDLRGRIGADTPVTYLAFGDIAYFLGNPTRCRYPSPVFLQRTQYLPGVHNMESFREALACVDSGSYLIVDPTWFSLAKVDNLVRERVARRFDCHTPLPRTGDLRVCPRRPS